MVHGEEEGFLECTIELKPIPIQKRSLVNIATFAHHIKGTYQQASNIATLQTMLVIIQ